MTVQLSCVSLAFPMFTLVCLQFSLCGAADLLTSVSNSKVLRSCVKHKQTDMFPRVCLVVSLLCFLPLEEASDDAKQRLAEEVRP